MLIPLAIVCWHWPNFPTDDEVGMSTKSCNIVAACTQAHQRPPRRRPLHGMTSKSYCAI